MKNLSVPEPAPAAMERSRALSARIRAEMEASASGVISFQRFMELALYEPVLGYYQSDSPKFGEEGDFVTAPEISFLFSRCIARQTQQILGECRHGDVLEVGAGSGIMAADLMAELDAQGVLPENYLILERSQALRQLQRATIEARVPSLLPRFHWLDDLPGTGFRGVVVANELLDAMPVGRFHVEEGQVREWQVVWSDKKDHFDWQLTAPHPQLERAVRDIEEKLGERLPDGYSSEVHLSQVAWIKQIAERLEQGLLLLLDYGYPRAEYYHPQRDSGTLVCHYRHRVHDELLFLPGLQDMSVHVDFSAIAEAAADSMLEVAGFTTQRDFLIASGLLEFCTEVDPGSPHYLALVQGVKTLTLPGEMGDMVKAMALTRGVDPVLLGFTGLDLLG